MHMLLCSVKWYREVIDYRGEEREEERGREERGREGER